MKIIKYLNYIVVGFLALIVFFLLASVLPIPGNFQVKTVISGSMEPKIKIGSLVVVKPMKEYEVGDIITFSGSGAEPVTHRIADTEAVSGKLRYITKGDANNAPDTNSVSAEKVIGKVLLSVPYFGYAIEFSRQPLFFVLIIGSLALLVIYDRIRKIKRELKDRNKA